MANDRKRDEQSRRMKASERRAATSKGSNPFNTISARQRRARTGRQPTSLTSEPREARIDQSTLAEILAHPTKEVSEDELRQQYSYVVADLRSMGLLAASLMVLLVVLATLLPT
jgi:hypothetical protein